MSQFHLMFNNGIPVWSKFFQSFLRTFFQLNKFSFITGPIIKVGDINFTLVTLDPDQSCGNFNFTANNLGAVTVDKHYLSSGW